MTNNKQCNIDTQLIHAKQYNYTTTYYSCSPCGYNKTHCWHSSATVYLSSSGVAFGVCLHHNILQKGLYHLESANKILPKCCFIMRPASIAPTKTESTIKAMLAVSQAKFRCLPESSRSWRQSSFTYFTTGSAISNKCLWNLCCTC